MTVAVVGAGPSGMLAAILLAQRGQEVHLLDEQFAAGGHLTYDQYDLPGTQGSSSGLLRELESSLRRVSVVTCLNSVAWGAFRTSSAIELLVSGDGLAESTVYERLVIATGSTDRAIQAPGCTLPGVMTARAVRILAERHGVVPGKHFAIVGGGRDADRLTNDIVRWGASVEVVVKQSSLRRIVGQTHVRAIETIDGVTDVDIVAIAVGELPDIQLPGMLGLECTYDPSCNGWRPRPQAATDNVIVVGGAAVGSAELSGVLRATIDILGDGTELGADLSIVKAINAQSGEDRR